jgi:hypothetical protein
VLYVAVVGVTVLATAESAASWGAPLRFDGDAVVDLFRFKLSGRPVVRGMIGCDQEVRRWVDRRRSRRRRRSGSC